MRFLLVIGALLLASVSTTAQTTGRFGFNNYCVGPFFTNSTSCTNITFPGGASTALEVNSRVPGLPVFIFVSLTNPCSAGALCFPFTTCGSIPFTACGGTTNMSLDIIPGAFPPFVSTSTLGGGGTGLTFIPVTLPPGITFSTQAVIIDPVCGVPAFGPSLNLLFTQAYNVST